MNAESSRFLKPLTVVRTVVLAGFTAVAGSSCVSYPPPGPDGNVFIEGRPRYGYGGTQSPNNQGPSKPPSTPKREKVPDIQRDPNNTTVDVTPPEPKPDRTPEPDQPPADNTNPPVEKTSPPPADPNPTREDLPYGTPVVGKPGFVYSPYYTKGEVNAVGIATGTKVRCPYTKKIFRVP